MLSLSNALVRATLCSLLLRRGPGVLVQCRRLQNYEVKRCDDKLMCTPQLFQHRFQPTVHAEQVGQCSSTRIYFGMCGGVHETNFMRPTSCKYNNTHKLTTPHKFKPHLYPEVLSYDNFCGLFLRLCLS